MTESEREMLLLAAKACGYVVLCAAGRVEGAELIGKTWILPDVVRVSAASRTGGPVRIIQMAQANREIAMPAAKPISES
jgi:hypothetical protein